MPKKSTISNLLISLLLGGGMVLLVSQIVKAQQPSPEVVKYEFKIIENQS